MALKISAAMASPKQSRIERRLAAVLAADVAGFGRLMSLDEETTHTQLKNHQHTLVDPTIAEHRGRIVKKTGDGVLAEFNSIVDAVRCALDVQRGMGQRNSDVRQEQRIQFRVGINVGDIIIDDGDVFGDTINIAARLEGFADPAAFASLKTPTGSFGAKLSWPSSTWANRDSRTSPNQCASIASFIAVHR